VAHRSLGLPPLPPRRRHPVPSYGDRALATWASRLADLFGPKADVYVYFNNDQGAAAVRDAARFAHAAQRAGLDPARTPAPGDIRVE